MQRLKVSLNALEQEIAWTYKICGNLTSTINKHFDESTKKLLEELPCADFYLFGLKKKKKKLKKSLNLPENQKNKKRLKKIHPDLNVLSYRIERRSEEKKYWI